MVSMGLAKCEQTGLEHIHASLEPTVHLESSFHYALNSFVVYLSRT